jgi:hypothetical protein
MMMLPCFKNQYSWGYCLKGLQYRGKNFEELEKWQNNFKFTENKLR